MLGVHVGACGDGFDWNVSYIMVGGVSELCRYVVSRSWWLGGVWTVLFESVKPELVGRMEHVYKESVYMLYKLYVLGMSGVEPFGDVRDVGTMQ